MVAIVSIIIVNYKVRDELFNCIKSIYNSKNSSPFEIIVVDNDEKKTIGKDLQNKFPKVKYIESPENNGFGAGNNLGAKYAKGEYLFFLNPDTLVKIKAIDLLLSFIQRNKSIGIVAPLLLHENNKPFKQQGLRELNILNGIFSLSFINKLFPNNPISKKYWLYNWDKKSTKEVDCVPGTAFLIEKKVFQSINGFDENFFLYFEENDLCKRVKNLGFKLFILDKAKVVHLWEKSTKQRSDIMKIFKKSRYYYFKKHFGLISALAVESFLRINKTHVFLFLSIFIGYFLRTFKLSELALLTGDHGWFLLSARDFIINGNFPLVGITSSHPFLHHGAFWTYILIPLLYFSNFNVLAPYFFTAFLDLFAILGIYFLGKEMFGRRIGAISAFLYAVSPFMILNARLGYHLSPIPLFSILFVLSVHRWMKGKHIYLPISLFLASVLFNFELSTAVLFLIPIIILGIKFKNNRQKTRSIFSKKYLLFSFLAILTPMMPFLIHGASNRFSQTFGFAVWVFYRIGTFIMPSTKNSFAFSDILNLSAYGEIYNRILFPSIFVSVPIFLFSIFYLIKINYEKIKKNNILNQYFLLLLWIFIPVLGMLFHKLPSEYHVLMFTPALILMTAIFISSLITSRKAAVAVSLILAVMLFTNTHFLIRNNFFVLHSISEKKEVAKKIIKEASGKRFNLIENSPFYYYKSSLNDYAFIFLASGIEQSKYKENLKFIITENKKNISFEKIDGKE